MSENSSNPQNLPNQSAQNQLAQNYSGQPNYNPTIVINNSAHANSNGGHSLPRKSKLVTFIICILFGWIGLHRFYTGHLIIGILYLCTLSFFGIGYVLDILWILIGSFKDANGQLLQ